jgi:MoxR-like ATPase
MKTNYPFDLIRSDSGPLQDKEVLMRRPFVDFEDSLEKGARKFDPGEELEVVINTAIALGVPLLISGEPGTGKTQAAYYAAYKLGLEPVLRYQVKSDSSARDLLYKFDTVRYFHEASVRGIKELPEKITYLDHGCLWQAMAEDPPRVLLIDEIDKAPRDFPNDLLRELDEMRFSVPEVPGLGMIEAARRDLRPIVFITSNQERRLPEAFLRRCAYYHIVFSKELLEKAVRKRKEEEFPELSEGFLALALERFLALRELNLRKPPATAEFLLWLRVLASRTGVSLPTLSQNLSALPYLSLLIKDRQDLRRLGREV